MLFLEEVREGLSLTWEKQEGQAVSAVHALIWASKLEKIQLDKADWEAIGFNPQPYISAVGVEDKVLLLRSNPVFDFDENSPSCWVYTRQLGEKNWTTSVVPAHDVWDYRKIEEFYSSWLEEQEEDF